MRPLPAAQTYSGTEEVTPVVVEIVAVPLSGMLHRCGRGLRRRVDQSHEVVNGLLELVVSKYTHQAQPAVILTLDSSSSTSSSTSLYPPAPSSELVELL